MCDDNIKDPPPVYKWGRTPKSQGDASVSPDAYLHLGAWVRAKNTALPGPRNHTELGHLPLNSEITFEKCPKGGPKGLKLGVHQGGNP